MSRSIDKVSLIITCLLIAGISVGRTLGRNEFSSSAKEHSSSKIIVPQKKEATDVNEKTTDEVFKNIKVLKGLPASRLQPTMRFIGVSLGFNCGNCHVRDNAKGWEWDKDDKPEKRKARSMIEMMNAINNNSFKGEQEVTCYTCHRGSANPVMVPEVHAVAAMNNKNENGGEEDKSIKIPNRLNTPQEIIDKYVAAIGGKEAFRKITSLKYEGTSSTEGKESPITIYQKAPDLYFNSTKTQRGEMLRCYDGNIGWMKFGQFTRQTEGDDLEDIKLASDIYSPIDIEKNYSALKLDDVQLIGNDTVYVVDGRATNYRTAKFYFSSATGLLVRQIIFNQTALGKLQVQTDFKDYRDVNGVLMPFELTVSDSENKQEIKFSGITPNVPVEANMFQMPAKQ